MLGAFRIIKRKDGFLVDCPVSMELTREEAIKLQKYFDSGELPTVGHVYHDIDSGFAEKLATIQSVLLDPFCDFAFKSSDGKNIILNGKYKYEISVYSSYFS